MRAPQIIFPLASNYMYNKTHELKCGEVLHVKEAAPCDAAKVISHVESTCGESDYLSFGPGEFGISEEEEVKVLHDYLESEEKVYFIGLIGDEIVASLSFAAGKRKRMRHYGEFGMCVRKKYWGLGIGSVLVDELLEWAERSKTIRKINLSVRTDNRNAIHLYLKKGFEFEGKISNALRIGEVSYDTYCMGRKVSQLALHVS